MPLIWVTGISGSGKSALRGELRARGHTAYGTDEDHLAGWVNRETGARIGVVPSAIRTEAWHRRHDWMADRLAVERIAAAHPGETIFVCGVVANEREIWDLFSLHIALYVDEETVVRRISQRTDNGFGKSEHELQAILKWQRDLPAEYARRGHSIVDGRLPLPLVADRVIGLASGQGVMPPPPAIV